jgi:hypothetical protein
VCANEGDGEITIHEGDVRGGGGHGRRGINAGRGEEGAAGPTDSEREFAGVAGRRASWCGWGGAEGVRRTKARREGGGLGESAAFSCVVSRLVSLIRPPQSLQVGQRSCGSRKSVGG